jgi:hypothetical protein
MVEVRPNRWFGGTAAAKTKTVPQWVIQVKMLSRVFVSASLASATMPRHREGQFVLDEAFAFIEGTPDFAARGLFYSSLKTYPIG